MLSIFAKDIDILSSRIDTIKHLAGGEISKETRKRRGLIDAAGDLFLCHNTLLYSTSDTTICEVLLRIRKPLTIPESCDMKTVNASIEIYHQISSNEWLFITTKPVGAAIICEDSTSDVIDISLERTGLLKLSARCKCFTSSTTLIAVANKSGTFRNHIPDVQILPSNIKDSRSTPIRLETLRLSHENLDSLETSRKELKDINDALERQLSKPFVEKHFSSFNILWFLTSLILVGLVLTIQHWIRKIRTKTTSPASTTVRFMAASESKSEVNIAGDLFLCHNTLLYSTSETTICEVLLRIRKPLTIPESCDMKTVNASIEIYHQISSNEWLFITTKPVGAAIICEDSTSDVIDISLERTGLLKLSARCKCFTSSTTLIAVANKSSTFRNHIPDVQILPSNIKDSRSTPIRLETLRLSHENLDSLETSRKELKDINDELERQLSKPFVEKHFSSSNILWILTSLILVGLVLTIQHWIRKIQTKTTSPASTTVRFMAASERKSEVKSENTESPPTGVVKTFQTNRGV
ncbi:hypothetical protein TcasGA2_TC031593 [Tribolium castaneum]|uniref:Envelope fusion protein n=1 Tax=Tribolium castaneum TaxID=7070 RepID=A0A139W8F2_TRICA|nr:hypothetical protein TcasGA2_TC031593 [Tribolium castaneum]